MTLYYKCPWCNKEDDAEIWDLPTEYACSWCSKDIIITVIKDENNETQEKKTEK